MDVIGVNEDFYLPRNQWGSSGSLQTVGSKIVRRNEVPNPSFEAGTAGWTGYAEDTLSSTTSFMSQMWPQKEPALAGNRLALMTCAGVRNVMNVYTGHIPLNGNSFVAVHALVATESTNRVRIGVYWTNGSSTLSSEFAPLQTADFYHGRLLSAVMSTKPAGATHYRFALQVTTASGDTMPAGNRFWLDQCFSCSAPTEAAALEMSNDLYFDGDTPAGNVYQWDGTRGESPSVELKSGVATRRNLAPNPSFETGISQITPSTGTDLVTIESTDDPYSVTSGVAALQISIPATPTSLSYIFTPVAVQTAGWLSVKCDVRSPSQQGWARLRAGFGGTFVWLSDYIDLSQTNRNTTVRGSAAIPSGFSGTANVYLYLYGSNTGDPAPRSATFTTDSWVICTGATELESQVKVENYFDGDSISTETLYTNIISPSVQEDATPVSPTSGGGGTGQLTYSRPEKEDDDLLRNSKVSFYDNVYGSFVGDARNISITEGLTAVTVDGVLSRLNKWYSLGPFIGSLSDFVDHLNVVSGANISWTLTDPFRVIWTPGFQGNMFEELRNLCIANKLEMLQRGNSVIIRDAKSYDISVKNVVTTSTTFNTQTTAEKVRVYYYSLLSDPNELVPQLDVFSRQTDADFNPISVGAGETVVQDIQLSGSVTSVNQPVAQDYVSAEANANGTDGFYCVAGADGKPILASRWRNGGGSLQVLTTDDPSVIRVVVTGSKEESYAPYSIAATAGESNMYNSLHITGTGTLWEKKSIEMYTGVPRTGAEDETPTEIDNRYVMSAGTAYALALEACAEYVGGLPSITGTAQSLSPDGLGDIGVVAGGRFRDKDNVYRVDTVTISPNNVQYSASADTLFSDVNDTMSTGETFAQFNARLREGMTMGDFNNRPLRK